MIVPGPKTTFILQAPTETRTSGGGVANAWAAVVTFQASLEPVSTSEVSAFGRDAEIFTHLSIIGYEEIGDTYATDLKAKNRLYVANADNALDAETFDIIGVEPQRYPGNEIATFEVMLRRVN